MMPFRIASSPGGPAGGEFHRVSHTEHGAITTLAAGWLRMNFRNTCARGSDVA